MSWSLFKHLTNSLNRKALGSPRVPTQWPSEASALVNDTIVGACRRASFLRLVTASYEYSETDYAYNKDLVQEIANAKTPPNEYLQYIWKYGELFEDWLVDQVKASGVFIDTQVPVLVPTFNTSGKIDVIVINPDTGKYSIVECKSVYSFNASTVLGTESQNRRGIGGKPRDSHLMQIGLYQSTIADNRFEDARLLYGARDTGRHGEYLIKIVKENGNSHIAYKMIDPIITGWTISGITIESIFAQYKMVLDAVKAGTIPPRDYDLQYSLERIEELYNAGELTKVETAQFEKIKAREDENALRILDNKKPLKSLQPIPKGDYQCGYCQYQRFCYDTNGQPRRD